MQKIPRRMIISSMAGLVIIIICTAVAYLSHKQFSETIVSQTQQQLLMTAKTAAKSLEEFIAKHSEALKTIARNPLFQKELYRKVLHDKPDSGYCLIKTFYEVHENDVDALTTLDANGVLLHRHPFWEDNKNRVGVDHTDKPGVAYVVKERKSHVSKVFYNNLGNLAISISEPVFYKGEFVGIVRWMIQTDTISKRFIQPIKAGREGYAWLFDDKEVVLSHPKKEFIGMSVLDVIRKRHTEGGETFDESRLKEHIREEHDYLNRVKVAEGYGTFIDCTTGTNDLVAYKKVAVGDRNWNLIITLPYSEISGPINRHARNTFGLAGLIVLVFGTGGVLLFRAQKKKTELEAETKYLKEIAESAEAVRESEGYLKTLLDSIHAGIMVIDPETHTLADANSSALKMMAINKDQIIGRICHEFICPAEMGKCPITDLKQTLDLSERILINANGERIPILKSVVPLMRKGRRYLIESFIDITERKRAEEEKENIRAQLFHAQKMEAIGTMAGGIAHDFNNILTVMRGNAQLIDMDLDPADPHSELLKEIEKQAVLGSTLTRQLLGFARGGKYEVKPINLNDVVRESSTAFGRTKKQLPIHLKLQEDLPPVEADAGQIEQVLMNLYVNAAYAMPGGGDLYLETRAITHEEIQVRPSHMEPGAYVLLSVRDTGVGMDKETRERIFDPFFTTREMGRGTGLGLASVYGIIENHKGYIDVESEKGRGTTFKIYLPISKKDVTKSVKVADQVIKGTETILLVDDEEQVLKLSVRVLNSLGYTVLEARNGREAVDVYKKEKDKIGLVVLDMIMPDMGGGKAYDLLKEANPDIKVLLCSGYSIDGQAMEILDRGCDGFIQKPFDIKGLSHRIREILDEK
ncbi:MAG: response regulator [Deltaproteobacteria bacterium]|nr:response regulator [Deltaproteobacteria bacterium]